MWVEKHCIVLTLLLCILILFLDFCTLLFRSHSAKANRFIALETYKNINLSSILEWKFVFDIFNVRY